MHECERNVYARKHRDAVTTLRYAIHNGLVPGFKYGVAFEHQNFATQVGIRVIANHCFDDSGQCVRKIRSRMEIARTKQHIHGVLSATISDYEKRTSSNDATVLMKVFKKVTHSFRHRNPLARRLGRFDNL